MATPPCMSNTGPSQQTRLCTIVAADIEIAHAAEAHAEAAGHLLLHRHLAGNAELPRQGLLHPQQPGRAAGEERIASPRSAISPRSRRSTWAGPLLPSLSVTVEDGGAAGAEQFVRHHEVGPAGGQDGGDAHARLPAPPAAAAPGWPARRRGRSRRYAARPGRGDSRCRAGRAVAAGRPAPGWPGRGCRRRSPCRGIPRAAPRDRRRRGSSAGAGTAPRRAAPGIAAGRTGRAQRWRPARCNPPPGGGIRRSPRRSRGFRPPPRRRGVGTAAATLMPAPGHCVPGSAAAWPAMSSTYSTASRAMAVSNPSRAATTPTTTGPKPPTARPRLNSTFCAVARAAVG